MVKLDIHRYKKRIKNALKRIKESDFPESNKRDLFEFYDYLSAEGLSKGRIAKYMYHMLKMGELIDIPFEDVDKKKIVKIVGDIENRDYTPHTKHDYKIILKRFFQWLRGTEEYPEEVRWIKSTLKKCDTKLPEELLNQEDIKKMIENAYYPRNKALVAFLFESGCRVGELISLKIRNLEFDDLGCLVTLDGKTGMRKIRVVSSVPHLSLWLENHPFRNDRDAWLWASISNRGWHKPISYHQVKHVLRDLAEKSGVKKKVNPHAFRHSRASQMANHLTEAQMNNYFGWVQGSDMPSVYVHLSGRDMDSAILKMNGIKTEETEKKSHFAPKKCPRCKNTNSPTGKICVRCGAPLDVTSAMEIENKRKRMDRLMSTLMKDPETQRFLLGKMRTLRDLNLYKSTEEPYPTSAVSGNPL